MGFVGGFWILMAVCKSSYLGSLYIKSGIWNIYLGLVIFPQDNLGMLAAPHTVSLG